MGGFTVYDDAPILANRLANGNVHVEMPVRVLGTAKFKAETRTLPDEVFTTGIELPPDKIVGVRSYEDSGGLERSEEHTSELQSLMRISYAVFCLKKKIHYHTDSI